jgi:glycosyltransferase involved in cell wall biosynthesis
MEDGVANALRVALVAPPWFEIPPAGYGGIENVVAVLASALVDLGHHIVLIGSGEARTPAEFRQTLAVPPSGRLTDSVPEIMHAAITAEILDSLDVDVIHDHSLAGPLVTIHRATPAVVTAHCMPLGDHAALLRQIGKRAALTALSETQRAIAPDLNWTAVVPNAVDVASFPYTETKSDFALYVGRLAQVKRVHLAIDAARAAGTRLKIAGPINDPGELEYVIAEIHPRLGPDVELLGPVDAQAKRSLFADACCLIFPSSSLEPFGLVMIEAMACGTPVAAFRESSAAEVVVHGITGFLADDPSGLADAVRQSTELLPVNCRRHATAHFDARIAAQRYVSVYRDAIEKFGEPRGTPGYATAPGPR